MSHGFGGAQGLRMQLAGGTAEDVEELAFLLHVGIASDESAKRVKMSLDAKSIGWRQGGTLPGFDVAELVNPVIELGLLLRGKFEKAAVGAGFDHKKFQVSG